MTDLRYAVRQLLKAPGFALVAILTLALGIGACTAIFSVVNGVLLRPLDYPESERLVLLKESFLPRLPIFSASPPNYLDWEKQAKSYTALAASTGIPLNLLGEGEPQGLAGLRVTERYFEVYGVKPFLGRFFPPEGALANGNRAIVLSYGLWQRLFGGAPDVIGRTLQINRELYTVTGVAPANLEAGSRYEAWVPMAFTDGERSNNTRGSHFLDVVGRLKPGVTVEQADAEIKTIAAQLAQQYPDKNKGWTAFAAPLLDFQVREVRPMLYTLFGAVACTLLIACANIANLLLARAAARHQELSIRTALGAGRGRLIRQLLTESMVLAVLGGGGGILLANGSLTALLSLAPSSLPRTADIHLDGWVFGFALVVSLATGLIFGLAPAWFSVRPNANDFLKQGSRGITDSRARGRLRGALLVTEVALSLVLLTSAALFIRSFNRLARVDPGFDPVRTSAVFLSLPAKKYSKPTERFAFADAVIQRVRTLPGVDSVGIAQTLPIAGNWVHPFEIEGHPKLAPHEQPNGQYYAITPDYFRVMGIRLVRGRAFTEHDTSQSAPVAIISETTARLHFPSEDPLGRRIMIDNGVTAWREIVGIAGDVKQSGLDRDTVAQLYEPYSQKNFPWLNLIVRTAGDSTAALGSLRAAVHAVDPEQPIGGIQSLETILARSMARPRFAMLLLTLFSLVAFVIAVVGIYGVTAYNATQRTGEIGIRIALGAQRRDVLQLVLGQGGRLVGLGLLIGLPASIATAYLLRSLLFQTSGADPLTLGAITLLLSAAALLACWVPAARATKVDPLTALRAE